MLQKLNKIKIVLFFFISIFILNILSVQKIKAEGSYDLIQDGGSRSYLRNATIIKVYAEEGETINLGSNNGNINYSAPDGTSGSCTTTNNINNTALEAAGPLPNVGGYNPCTVTVGAGQDGVWYIDYAANNLTYWDATVFDTGNNPLTGRVYVNEFDASMQGWSKPFNGQFYVQTKDCYQYLVDNNGLDPFVFQFYANNKGITDNSGNPTYQSGNSNTNVHDPESPDTATDFTHKLFLNAPDSNMPANAPIADTEGTTWLYCEPDNPKVENFGFIGVEGTPNKMGAAPMGGYFSFDYNIAGNTVSLELDFNGNGIIDANDRVINTSTTLGLNQIYWDGLDGNGNPVNPAGGASVNLLSSIAFQGGEVHFPVWDAEASNGLIITRLTGPGSPDSLVNWDDSNITTNSANNSGIAPSPITSPTGGVDSTANNVHAWGINSGGSYVGAGSTFGNGRLIDTWSFVEIPPVNLKVNIDICEADLEVVEKKILNTPSIAIGETARFEFTVTNNGPDNVVNALVSDTFETYFNNINFISCTPTSGANCGTPSIVNNNFSEYVDIEDGASITYIIEADISGIPSDDNLKNQVEIIRPADVYDPDATNEDSAVPTNIASECPTGSCNNVKTVTYEPEPEIGLNKTIDSFNVKADGSIDIIYKFKLENTGNANLSTVEIKDQLSLIFSGATYTVTGLSSNDFIINNAYNGSTIINMLDTNNALAVGESGEVLLSLNVIPASPAGVYNNTATATGTSNNGKTAEDKSNNSAETDPDNDGDPTNNSIPTPFPEFVNLSTSTKEVEDLNGVPNEPGDIIRYTINLINTGNTTATGVDIIDNLDTNLILNTSSINLNTVCNGGITNASTTSTLDVKDVEVPVGLNCVIEFDVTIVNPLNEGTIISNTAKVNNGDKPGVGGTPTADDLKIEGTPDLSTSNKTYEDTNNSPIEPEDIIKYTLNIINTGNAQGTGIDISDTIDTNTENLDNITIDNSVCGNSHNDTSTSSLLDIEDLIINAGETCIITYEVEVKSPLPPGTELSNNVNIQPAEEGGNGAFPSTTTNPVESSPDLSTAEKTIEDLNGDTLKPGERIKYTISIPNTGNANGSGINILDVFDSSTQIVDLTSLNIDTNCGSAYDSSTSNGNTLNIQDLEINAGETCIFTIETNTISPLNEGTLIENFVTIFPAEEGGDGSIPAVSPPLPIDATPDLSTSTKDVIDLNGGTVEPGDILEYTITLINIGDGQATGVSITDTIDTDTTNLANLNLVNCGTAYNNLSTTTNLNLNNLNVEVETDCIVTYTVEVKSPSIEGTLIENQANIKGSNEGDTSADPEAAVLEIDVTPDLSTSTKNVIDLNGGTVEPGDILEYTITLINTGNGLATGVDVQDIVDSNTILNTGSVSTLNCGLLSDISNTNSTEISVLNNEIQVGNNCIIKFKVQINTPLNEGTLISNTATIGPGDEGGNGSNPSSPNQEIDATPELSVSKSQNIFPVQTIEPDQPITYTIEIENTGNGAGTTSLMDIIPTSFVSAPTNFIYTNCGAASESYNTPNLEINNITINASEICSISYDVIVKNPVNENTVIQNSVNVEPSDEGGNELDTTNAPELYVDTTPDLSTSTKDVTDLNGGTPEPGDILEYTITLINTGTGQGTTSISDEMDDNLLLDINSVNTTDCGSLYTNIGDSDTVELQLVQIDVGINCIIKYEAEIENPSIEGEKIENSVVIDDPEEGGNGGNPSSETLEVDGTPELNITKQVIETEVNQDGTVEYLINISNTGNARATGITFTDTLEPILINPNIEISNCSNYTDLTNGNIIILENISLNSNENCTIKISAEIDEGAQNGEIIHNTAEISAAIEGSNTPEPAEAEEVEVFDTAELLINKKVITEDYNIGDEIEYTITVENLGPNNATNLVIKDILPEEALYISVSNNNQCAYSNGEIVCIYNQLDTGDKIELVVKVKYEELGEFVNSVYADSLQDNPINEESTTTAEVIIDKKLIDILKDKLGGEGLEIDKKIEEEPKYLGDKYYEVKYKITVTNETDFEIRDIQIKDDLDTAFDNINIETFEVVDLDVENGLTKNNNFNGRDNTKLLEGEDNLSANEEKDIYIKVKFKVFDAFEKFEIKNTAKAKGKIKSEDGEFVYLTSEEGTKFKLENNNIVNKNNLVESGINITVITATSLLIMISIYLINNKFRSKNRTI